MREMIPIEKGKYYHIYNRGINGEDIFKQEKNYDFFLKRWSLYIDPIAETYAYCLLKNHFHVLVHIRDEDIYAENDNGRKLLDPTRQFSHFFNSYAQSINKVYSRTGALFEHPFRRKQIDDEAYFRSIIAYIHTNPQKHGFIDDFRHYEHSSYGRVLNDAIEFSYRDKVINWYDSRSSFISFHDHFIEEPEFRLLCIED